MILYDFGEWRILGPDIENPENSERPLIKMAYAEDEDHKKQYTIILYKDIFDGIRNGIYEAVFSFHSKGTSTFAVYYHGTKITSAPAIKQQNSSQALAQPSVVANVSNQQLGAKQSQQQRVQRQPVQPQRDTAQRQGGGFMGGF